MDPPPRPTMMTSISGRLPSSVDPFDDLLGRAFPLDLGRADEDVQPGESPVQDPQDILDSRPARRGDQADFLREQGKFFLVRRVEEPLGPELLFELLEGQLQRAFSLGLR